MDFITGLPMTFRHHDAIWVVVCRFSKMAIFVPCTKTTTAAQTVDLFFTHVWTHFGLPSNIISDRDAHFLSTFWKTLWSLLGCHLKYSTSFHPCRWMEKPKLLIVAWSMPYAFSLPNLNSGMPPSTLSNTVIIGKFMFLLACPLSKLALGINLLPPMSFLYNSNLSGTPRQQKEKTSASSFLQTLARKQAQVFEALQASQQRYKAHHDVHRKPLSFSPGDKVWFHMEHQCFQSQRYHKLKPLCYGPYTVLQQVGDNAYRLDFPPQLGIHDVVNVNSLKCYEPPLLEEEVTISHPSELVPYFQPPLLQDTVLDTCTTTTRTQQHTSFLVGRKGQLPAQAKWLSQSSMSQQFPQFLMEVGHFQA
jgi:hypothetical protein